MTVKSSRDIVSFIYGYLRELDGVKEKKVTWPVGTSIWKPPNVPFIKLNFNAAFQSISFSATVGIVAQNRNKRVLMSCSKLKKNVASAFIVKSLACLKEVKIGLDRGFFNVIIEVDALFFVQKCNSNLTDI